MIKKLRKEMHRNEESDYGKSWKIQIIECMGVDKWNDERITRKGRESEKHYVIVKEPDDIYLDHLISDRA